MRTKCQHFSCQTLDSACCWRRRVGYVKWTLYRCWDFRWYSRSHAHSLTGDIDWKIPVCFCWLVEWCQANQTHCWCRCSVLSSLSGQVLSSSQIFFFFMIYRFDYVYVTCYSLCRLCLMFICFSTKQLHFHFIHSSCWLFSWKRTVVCCWSWLCMRRGEKAPPMQSNSDWFWTKS